MPSTGTILLGVLIILLIAALLIGFYKYDEGFTTQAELNSKKRNFRRDLALAKAGVYKGTGQGGSIGVRNAFADNQKDLFYQGFNKALFTNSGLQKDITDNITSAIGTTDTLNNNSNSPLDFTMFFEDDPFPGLDEENKQCANVLEPSLMPPREKNALKGCGWWYVDSDDVTSVGALGTDKGPLNFNMLNEKYKGGTWVWNIQAAQKKEDVKRCRKVKSCETADMVPGKCGFCPGLNRGVPVNAYGQSIYEDDPDLNCGSSVVQKPSNCPRPEPVVDSDGQVTNPAASRLICDPNPATGKLTSECLMSLANAAGCKDEGAIMHILKGDSGQYLKTGANGQKFNIATQYLFTNNSLASDLAYFGKGVCTRSEALDYYNRVVRLAITANNQRSQDAAKFLVTDSTIFNECAQKPEDMGPYILHCLQNEARDQGWQPAGTDFPTRDNKERYDNMNWGAVQKYFKSTIESTKSDDYQTQAPAVKKALGITITEPQPDCGDTNGLSTYVYQWNYDWSVTDGRTPKAIFYGRMTSPTFPEINNNGSFTPYNIGTDRIHIRIKAQLKSSTSLQTRFWVMTDDGITVNVDGKTILSRWYDQGPTSYESPSFTINENSSKKIMSDWYNNAGGYVAIYRMYLDGKYQPIPASLIQQTQPTGYPIARWDFYEGYVNDRCGTLDSQVVGNVPISTLDGKKCAMFTGRSHIKITNGIKTTAFRSITMMMNIKRLVGPWPRPWEFNNNGFSGSWCDDALFGCMSPNNSNGVGFYAKQGCTGPELWTGGNTITTGKWYHIAWVLDEDLMGMTIYIDGARAGRYQDSSFRLLINKIYRNMYIFTSVEQFDKDVGVGWFRMFDYPLSTEDIRTDRMNGWSTKDLFPKSQGTGF
jgi:hypothetical protein